MSAPPPDAPAGSPSVDNDPMSTGCTREASGSTALAGTLDRVMGKPAAVTLALLLGLTGGAGPVSHDPVAESAVRTRAATETHGVEPPTTLDVVTYSPPVGRSLKVLRGFDSTTTRYGPGHRGLDLYVSLDRRVLAAADGVVTFAGPVAGRGVLVVQHSDGIRTEYEPVRPVVVVGAHVQRGTTVGLLTGRHRGCAPDLCLHWSARRGGVYLDPSDLLRPLGPVRLLPWPDR